MICATYKKENKLVISNQPVPQINNDEVLLKVDACGVCGSDIVKIKKDLVPEGTVLGHEVVGTIEQVGSLVRNWSKGQKVVVAHHVPCLACHFCKHGNFSMCKQFKNTNFTPGGFSEYLKLSRYHLEQTTFLIPKGTVSDFEIALTEPLACCLRAIERADVSISNTVLISGLGSIGNLIGKLCIEKGAHTIGIDILEERLNFSRKIKSINEGFIAGANSTKDFIMKKTDSRGVDIVFLSSGNTKSINDAVNLVRSGGKIIVFSSIQTDIGFSNNDIYYKELSIIGSYSPSPKTLKDSYQLIITGKIKLKDLITDVVDLKNLPTEIEKCLSNKSLKMIMKN